MCLETTSTGRFDEQEKCVEYGKPLYIPVGEELRNNFKQFGLYSGIWIVIIGVILMKGQQIEERKIKQ